MCWPRPTGFPWSTTSRSGEAGGVVKLDGRTAVVTGGASGLGRSCVEHLVRDKRARVAILDLAGSDGAALARELGESNAMFCAVDVADEASVAAAIADVRRRFGTVDVCVNCAGIPASTKMLDRSGEPGGAEVFRRAIAVNLFGTFNVMAHCAAAMRSNTPTEDGERGVVVNVASIAAFQPVPSLATYAATKAYVLSLTESLSEELKGTGVSITALCPGITATNMMSTAQGANPELAQLPGMLVGNADVVAAEGYEACMKGEVIRVPGIVNLAITLTSRASPRWLLRRISGTLGRKTLRG